MDFTNIDQRLRDIDFPRCSLADFESQILSLYAGVGKINFVSMGDDTLLTKACQEGRLDLVKLMIMRYEVDINEIGGYEASALFYAVMSRNLPLVEFLLNNGANIRHTDMFGDNVFQWVQNGDSDMRDLLESYIIE